MPFNSSRSDSLNSTRYLTFTAGLLAEINSEAICMAETGHIRLTGFTTTQGQYLAFFYT